MKQLASFMVILVLLGCQPSDTGLPTLVSLVSPEPQTAQTAGAVVTPSSSAPTGVPTFTPTAVPPSETPIPTRVRDTATPITFTADGTLYFVYNNDSIIAQAADGSASTLVMTFGVGLPIADLAPSPDGQLIAFVAPGNGAAREVYIMNRDGSYLQQISCLGAGDVRTPAWTPDASALTWYAAPDTQQTGNIYRATVVGSNRCPTDNRQDVLVRLQSNVFDGMAWNHLGDTLFYTTATDLLAFDPVTQASTLAVYSSGFGANRAPTLNPNGDQIALLIERRLDSGAVAPNAIILQDSRKDTKRPILPALFPPNVISIQWSGDNTFLMGASKDSINLRDLETGAVTTLVSNVADPVAVVSPDGHFIAYTRNNDQGFPQWIVYEIASGRNQFLVQNNEGSITEAIWLEGGLTG